MGALAVVWRDQRTTQKEIALEDTSNSRVAHQASSMHHHTLPQVWVVFSHIIFATLPAVRPRYVANMLP